MYQYDRVSCKDGSKSTEVSVLLDDCSTGTFCSVSLAKQLAIQSKPAQLIMTTMKQIGTKVKAQRIQLTVSSVTGDNKFVLPAVCTRFKMQFK